MDDCGGSSLKEEEIDRSVGNGVAEASRSLGSAAMLRDVDSQLAAKFAETRLGAVPAVAPKIADGQCVILAAGAINMLLVEELVSGRVSCLRSSNFHHDDIIGQPFGSKVYDRRSGRWVVVLNPSAELISKCLEHRTQIIFPTDANSILMLLGVKPGSTIIEAGTGSGALTCRLAAAAAPDGRVYTFDVNADRARHARRCFQIFGFDHIVQIREQDVCSGGFAPVGTAGHIVLDLPQPWMALPHIFTSGAISPLGRIVTFSPCIEQVQRTIAELRRLHCNVIAVVECLSQPWGMSCVQSSGSKCQDDGGTSANNKRLKAEETSVRAELVSPTNKQTFPSAGPESEMESSLSLKKKRSRAAKASRRKDLDSSSPGFELPDIALQFQYPTRGHTGYLVLASAPPVLPPADVVVPRSESSGHSTTNSSFVNV